ncbi:MAG: hypothetical protein ACOY4H_03950 [Thermodesulfobacteriota bacterium]
MDRMTALDEIYFSDVVRKLACARDIYSRKGSALLALAGIPEKLAVLERLAADLREQMAAMGMFAHCRNCGEKPGGGCCSAFMANETDAVLLLMNLLLGVEVSPQRDDLFECRYLGPCGCIFRVKPIFCLNYNCRLILESSDSHHLAALEKAAAAVLQEQTKLEILLLEQILVR